MKTRGNVLRVVLIGCALFSGGAAHGQAYTNWAGAAAADAEWIALTNHIAWVYGQINTRCKILGMDPIAPPSYENPTADYRRFAHWIDANASRFVDYTLSVNGNFNDYLSMRDADGYFNNLPRLTFEKLHKEAGFKEWAHHEQGFQSWALIEHKKEWLDQMAAALKVMKWTVGEAKWVDAQEKRITAYTTTWSDTWEQVVEQKEEEYRVAAFGPAETYIGPCAIYYSQREYYGATWIEISRTHAYAQVISPHSIYPAHSQMYISVCPASYYDYPPDVGAHIRDLNGDGLLPGDIQVRGEDNLFSSALVLQDSTQIDDQTPKHRVHFGDENLPLPARCDNPWLYPEWEEPRTSRGYRVAGQVSLLQWDVDGGLISMDPPPNPYAEGGPGADPAKAWMPDTDRDDLVDIGADINSAGNDTGIICWHPAQDDPHVVVPLLVTWQYPMHMVDYLTSTSVLPYQYSEYDDPDGFAVARSVSSRILGSVAYTNIEESVEIPVKRVALLRPRGQVVVFDFPRTNEGFSVMGYPMGIHASRTYVLRDRTPSNDVDGDYDLMFDSGFVHVFQGGVARVENVFRQNSNNDWWFFWMFNCAIENGPNGLPARVIHRFGSTTIAEVTIGYDDQFRIVSLTKTGGIPGMERMNYALSEDRTTITRGDGVQTTTRSSDGHAGEARTVTLVRKTPGGGEWSVATTYTSDDYLKQTVQTFGDTSYTRTLEYDSSEGRYDNGLFKMSRVISASDSEGGTAAFGWTSDTGWLSTVTYPTAWGSETTTYTYEAVDEYDPADPNRLVELPRLAVSAIGGNETFRRHTQFRFGSTIEIAQRDAVVPGDGWTGETYATTRTLKREGGNKSWTEQTPVGMRSMTYEYLDFDMTVSYQGPDGNFTASYTLYEPHEVSANIQMKGSPAQSFTCTARQIYGRPTRWDYPDGSYRAIEASDLFGPTRIRERDGSIRIVEYDGLGRTIRDVYLGREARYAYDALGRTIQTTVVEGDETIVTQAQYDVLGRLIHQSTPLASRSYTPGIQGGLRSWTMTDNAQITGDVVVTRHPDGQPASIGGAGVVVPLTYTYGFKSHDGQSLRTITEMRGAEEWTRTYLDLLGRPCYVERSGDATGMAIAYDEASRLRSITDPIGKRFLVEYEAGGVFPTAIGMDRDGSPDVLEPDGLDRRQNLAFGVGTSSHSVYPHNNQPTAALYSSSQVADDELSETVSYAGRTATAQRSAFTEGGAYTVTTALPGNESLEQAHVAFRPVSVELRDKGVLAEKESYEYAAFDRIEKIQSKREGVTEIKYDDARRVRAVTDRQGTTTLAYYDNTDLIRTVAPPGEAASTYDYYPNGQLKSVVKGVEHTEYEYDRGRLSTLRHFNGKDFSESAWTWDAQTGRLKSISRPGQGTWTYNWNDNGDFNYAVHPLGATISAGYTSGDLTSLLYDDGTTAGLGLAFDRLQRMTSAGYVDGVFESYGLALDGSRLSTIVSGPPVPTHSFVHAWDDAGDSLGWTLNDEDGTRGYAIGRIDAGRVGALDDTGIIVQYTAATNAPGIATCDLGKVKAEYGWDRQGTRLTNLVWKADGMEIASYVQTYPTNDVHRMERRARQDGSYWDSEPSHKG